MENGGNGAFICSKGSFIDHLARWSFLLFIFSVVRRQPRSPNETEGDAKHNVGHYNQTTGGARHSSRRILSVSQTLFRISRQFTLEIVSLTGGWWKHAFPKTITKSSATNWWRCTSDSHQLKHYWISIGV